MLTFGPQMKSTFNNMALGVKCGYLRRVKIPLCCTFRPEKASGTLGQYDSVMGSLYVNEKPIHSMHSLIGNS